MNTLMGGGAHQVRDLDLEYDDVELVKAARDVVFQLQVEDRTSVMNLVSNALKHGRAGGGFTFRVRLPRSRPLSTAGGSDATR